jgi:DNA-binding transcriptional MerR regulator
MLINELSKRTGVSIHTIRYYENLGLIQGKTNENVKTNNYKIYDENVVERIEIIKDAKEVGFTLLEVRELMNTWFSGTATREEILSFFEKKVAEIDSKIKKFKQIKKLLQNAMKEIEKGKC